MSCDTLLKKRPRSRLYPRKPNLQRRTPKYGEMWVWISFAPEYRLTLGSLVGGHNLATARKIIHQTRVKLDGNIPLFTTDQLPHYEGVLLETYHTWKQYPPTGKRGRPKKPRMIPHPELKYAQVIKEREKGRVVEVKRTIVFGREEQVLAACSLNGEEGRINTSYVERNNLTIRHHNRRLARKTLCFSKSRSELQNQMDFWSAYANFVRPHEALKIRIKNRWFKRTPAMMAEIADHIWSLRELLTYRPGRGP